MQNGESLLEAMLGFAADEEVLQSSQRSVLRAPEGPRHVSARDQGAARSAFASAEYVGVDNGALVGDQVDVDHARTLLGLKLAGTTGNQTSRSSSAPASACRALNWPEH